MNTNVNKKESTENNPKVKVNKKTNWISFADFLKQAQVPQSVIDKMEQA